ncbi:MAG: hypothetical protein NC314_13020 [Roseburia sp.]|nr:hypothetical protein [Roseburia sp.]MCM1243759.1 hypothetical protein [Roseburia sp.]
MKLKRVLAFVLASMLLMSSITVFAADGDPEPTNPGTTTEEPKDDPKEDPKEEKPASTSSSASETEEVSEQEIIESIVSQAEAAAFQAEAEDAGFADVVDMQIAAAKHMSAGEFYNNAVVATAGIAEATPVAQGSGIIINGVVTNVVATISKVDVAFVNSVRASVEGTVLNVVDVQFPATEATINFYMPGVTAGTDIAAVQYVDGAWVDVEVAEVRADHVVLNLKKNGKVAFVSK